MSTDADAGLRTFFTDDHQRCDRLWSEAEEAAGAGRADAARGKLQAFAAARRRHLAMEEEVLFPAFEQATGMTGGGPTFVMRSEHSQMRRILDEMERAAGAGDLDAVLAQGDTLLMVIQQHNVKEEGMLYPMAERALAAGWAAIKERLGTF